MKPLLTRARWLFMGVIVASAFALIYAQEPAMFNRGITITQGDLTVANGDINVQGSTLFTDIGDDELLSLGVGNDQNFLNRSTTLSADTVLTNVILGTPVSPALAANSLIISNKTADGDLVLLTQTGGNSSAVFFSDASAQTTSIMVTGVATARFDATDVLFPDDYILSLGTGVSLAYKDDATNANTAVTSVILGTAVTPAVAADTLIIANQIADGDLLFATQTGGNSQAALMVDGSAGTVNLYGAGVRQVQVDATSLNLGVAGTTIGRLEISGNTSGTISILPAAAAGTFTLSIPFQSTTDSALMVSTLTSNATGVANSVWGVSAGLTFEGSTADTEELFLTLEDPTADITITFKDDLAGTYHPLTNITADVTGGVFIMPPFGIAATDNDMTMSDNVMYVYRVYIPQWITVANVYAKGTQGGDIAGSDDLLGVAIYEDADAGTQLAEDTSADFTATATVTFDVTDVTLGPGMYRIGVCSGDGSGISFVAGDPLDDEAIDVYNLGAVTIGTAANACTSGVAAATTGALTTADILMPVLKLGP